MLFASCAIKLDSNGPIFFKQKRPGKKCEIFTVYKFRTMRIETEVNGVKLADVDRVTRLGRLLRKLSVDELPQLFNIIRGDMSFIGPRPLLVEYLEFYSTEQNRRHEVLPGISGLAQVKGRNSISWEQKFELDVWYVDHVSFFLDIKIVWLTIRQVISRKDINNSQNDTMPLFTGSRNPN